MGNPLKDTSKVDRDITTWLEANNEIHIISINQVALDAHTVLTTIIFE